MRLSISTILWLVLWVNCSMAAANHFCERKVEHCHNWNAEEFGFEKIFQSENGSCVFEKAVDTDTGICCISFNGPQCDEEVCQKYCHDHYWGCETMDHVERPDDAEVIDCSRDFYQHRCERLCHQCVPCQFVTHGEMDDALQTVEDRIAALEALVAELQLSQQSLRENITYLRQIIYNLLEPCLEDCDCEHGLCDHGLCVCDPGYEGNRCEVDVDECVGDVQCPANSDCVNTAGSYDCNCWNNYYKDSEKQCNDINECTTELAKCGVHEHCNNLLSSYECVCDDGYVKEGDSCVEPTPTSEAVTLCSPACNCNEKCVENSDGEFHCVCKDPCMTDDCRWDSELTDWIGTSCSTIACAPSTRITPKRGCMVKIFEGGFCREKFLNANDELDELQDKCGITTLDELVGDPHNCPLLHRCSMEINANTNDENNTSIDMALADAGYSMEDAVNALGKSEDEIRGMSEQSLVEQFRHLVGSVEKRGFGYFKGRPGCLNSTEADALLSEIVPDFETSTTIYSARIADFYTNEIDFSININEVLTVGQTIDIGEMLLANDNNNKGFSKLYIRNFPAVSSPPSCALFKIKVANLKCKIYYLHAHDAKTWFQHRDECSILV